MAGALHAKGMKCLPGIGVFLMGLALLQACASPAERLRGRADGLGLSHQILSANGFALEAFHKTGAKDKAALHVYLEGDGLAWASLNQVAADPTPRNPLMLKLMAQDGAPSLYVGRPCYNGHAEDPGCSPLLWTHRRFAPEVVESMAEALRVFLRGKAHSGLVFLGHSGGGALALLLASRFPETLAVVTVAGNADINAWADHHGYSRLQGSLNPADFPAGAFPEFHYLGGKDQNIPPTLFLPILKKRPNARVETFAGFDHVCCWESVWPEILSRLP